MKKCNVCNQILDDQAIFCPTCGSTDLSQISSPQASGQPMPQPPQTQSAQQPVQQPIQSVVQQPMQQPIQPVVQQPVQQPIPQPVQQPVQQPIPQPAQQPIQPMPQPPKKSKKGLIIAIVSVIAGAAVIAGLLIGFGVFSKETTTQNSTSTTASTTETTTAPSTTEPTTVPNSTSPSAGYFDSETSTYVNEWANFQIPLAGVWTYKNEKGLEEMSDDDVIYGFYATYDAAKYTKLEVAFADHISDPYGFLRKLVENASGSYLYEEKIYTDTLAGATYNATRFAFDEDGTTVYELMYLRELDGITIIIDYQTEDYDELIDFSDYVSTVR